MICTLNAALLNTSPPCLHNRFKDYKVSEIEGLKCSIYVKMQCKGTVKATGSLLCIYCTPKLYTLIRLQLLGTHSWPIWVEISLVLDWESFLNWQTWIKNFDKSTQDYMKTVIWMRNQQPSYCQNVHNNLSLKKVKV